MCTDTRLPEDQQEYDLRFDQMTGYQCTNIRDYNDVVSDIESKRKELAKLRRKVKKLNRKTKRCR